MAGGTKKTLSVDSRAGTGTTAWEKSACTKSEGYDPKSGSKRELYEGSDGHQERAKEGCLREAGGELTWCQKSSRKRLGRVEEFGHGEWRSKKRPRG